MRVLEKNRYRNCRFEILPHVTKRSIERNFQLDKIKEMVFMSKWMPHPDSARRTCVYLDRFNKKYWTIIIAPYERTIFIITIYESSYSEIKDFKSFKDYKISS